MLCDSPKVQQKLRSKVKVMQYGEVKAWLYSFQIGKTWTLVNVVYSVSLHQELGFGSEVL